MRVSAVQFCPEFGDIRGNLARVEEMMADERADLYVLPELALSGYLFESREEARGLAQTPDGEAFNALEDLARDRSATVAIGFAELAGEKLYNSSLMIGPDGARSVYRKVQLFCDEKTHFDAGDRAPSIVESGGVRFGMMICFDWIFPEVARTLALAGADVLCHSTNLVLPYCQDAMITRCIENRVFALTANRVGTESRAGQSLTFTGASQIVTPKGERLARAGIDTEEVIVADIDPSLARDKSVTRVNDVLGDRRPELYRLD